jgi:hypothetical protein
MVKGKAKSRGVDVLPHGMRNDPLLQLHWALQEQVDQLYALLTTNEDFLELRIKARLDGTCYALAKVTGTDGQPVVAFGSGYDALSALWGLEGAVHAGNWRPEKPWPDNDNGKGKGG